MVNLSADVDLNFSGISNNTAANSSNFPSSSGNSSIVIPGINGNNTIIMTGGVDFDGRKFVFKPPVMPPQMALSDVKKAGFQVASVPNGNDLLNSISFNMQTMENSFNMQTVENDTDVTGT